MIFVLGVINTYLIYRHKYKICVYNPEYKNHQFGVLFEKSIFGPPAEEEGPEDLLEYFSRAGTFECVFPIVENPRVQKISQFRALLEKSIFGPRRGLGVP